MGLDFISYSHVERVHAVPYLTRGLWGATKIDAIALHQLNPDGQLIACCRDEDELIVQTVAPKFEGLYALTSKSKEVSTGNLPAHAWKAWREQLCEIQFYMKLSHLWKGLQSGKIAYYGIMKLLYFSDTEGCYDTQNCAEIADDLHRRRSVGGPPGDDGLYLSLLKVFENGSKKGLVTLG